MGVRKRGVRTKKGRVDGVSNVSTEGVIKGEH